MNFFNKYSQVLDFYSSKSDGNMSLESTNLEQEKARTSFLQTRDINLQNLVSAGLVHGDKIAIVSDKDAGKIMPDTDALIARDKNVFLSVTFADCLPIFYFVPSQNIVGLAHAGWRGVAKKLPAKMVHVLVEKFQVKAEEILVAVGPYICQQHYQVAGEAEQAFGEYPEALDNHHLDLGLVVRQQLLAAGIKQDNIRSSNLCTFERDDLFFSYRRDKPKYLQTMIAVIGLK